MESFKTFINEALITFGGKAYPKFNQVVILAGGSGSGKGFTLKKLLGIEGIVFDVDRVKELAMASDKLSAKIKEKTGHDITNLDLKTPSDVSLLHNLLSTELKITSNMDKKVFAGVLAADPSRKPNLIFDITLKDMSKLVNISKQINELGYTKDNIHIVWVMNDVNIAIEQNKTRSRQVPVDVLLTTHEGASLTFKKLMAIGEGSRILSDGDWWVAFNKAKIDVTLATSENGGSYITKANYMKIKAKKHAPMKAIELDKAIVQKISEYTPNPELWKMVF